MSLLHTPKPPPAPTGARVVSRATEEDLAPAPRADVQRRSRRDHPSAALCARVECTLARGPGTPEEIAVTCGDHVSNVYSALRQMQREHRAHVISYSKPFIFALGPSPVGEPPFIPRRAPGTVTCVILMELLRLGPLTSRQVRQWLPRNLMHNAALSNAVTSGYLTREGTRGSTVYALSERGRALAEYLVTLHEVYRCI